MDTTHWKEKLFESNLLNKLAESNLHVALVAYPLVGALIFILGLKFTDIKWYILVLVTTASVFAWTFVEYALHRYLYHGFERIKQMRRFQYIFHGIHHANPEQEDKLIMPPAPWLVVLAVFFGLIYLFFRNYAFGILPGLVFGYVGYVYVHYNIHLANTPSWMKNNMIHHQLHHHRHHDKAFGVTTPLWDRILGTMPPERIGWNK